MPETTEAYRKRKREAKRRERLLRKAGLQRIPVLVHRYVVDVLVEHGQLAGVDRHDPEQVGLLIGRLLDDMVAEIAEHGRVVRGDRTEELAEFLADSE